MTSSQIPNWYTVLLEPGDHISRPASTGERYGCIRPPFVDHPLISQYACRTPFALPCRFKLANAHSASLGPLSTERIGSTRAAVDKLERPMLAQHRVERAFNRQRVNEVSPTSDNNPLQHGIVLP